MMMITTMWMSALLFMGCGDPVGADCELRSGALGFGFADDCAHTCLKRTAVTCPDGEVVRKAVCSGAEACTPGSCPDGQRCYAIEDPFDDDRVCIPADLCGADPGRAWEDEVLARAEALRAEYRKRAAARTGIPTAPAADAPTAPAAALPAPSAPWSVLLSRQGTHAALVGCTDGTTWASGAACATHLPAGTEFSWGDRTARVGGPVQVPCASAGTVTGVALDGAEGATSPWAWAPTAPAAFRAVVSEPVVEPLSANAAAAIPEAQGRELTIAGRVDFANDGVDLWLIRAFYPVDDPDKPGRTILWTMTPDGNVTPIPAADSLNGVQEVVGLMPMPNATAAVVFTSQWMGGQGLHVVTIGNASAPVSQVACGS